MNCILRCCGCNASVDSDQVLDTDGVVDVLEDLMEAMKKEPVLAYPLASRLPVFKKFRKSLSEFLSRLVISAAETGALYDEQLVAILQTWVMAMSSANLRSFRHTATVVALEMESALAEVAAAVDKEAEVLRRQREGEKKKAGNKGKGREQDLQTKFDDVQRRKKSLKELMKEIFDAVFVLRYRDADPGIRAECVQEFGVWVEKYPPFFLEGNHLRYIGWVLSDTNTQVRLAAVRSLYSLYKREELLVSTNHFTQRYKPRLVAMASSDVEVSVRVAVIQVLCAIDDLGELEEDQTEQMELLIFDQEPRVRKAISSFVHGVWKNAVDERLGKRRQGGDAAKDKERIGFKCLGALLVKWAKNLEKDDEGDTVLDQTESQAGASDSGAGGPKSKEVTALVSDLQRGRIALCVDSLWDEVDAVSDWEELMEFLLLDHSAEGEDDVSPVASKRKRAAEAKAKKGKGQRKSTVNQGDVDEVWRLEDAEEAVLVEVLVASLKKTIADAGEKKKGEADAVQADVTRALIKSLPQLFAKHQSDERRISDVILIPQVMNLDLYAEMGLNKAYESLWDEVIKHFLSHSSPIVIRNASITVSRLLTTSAMFRENEAKIALLEDELSTSLREVVAGRDDLDAAFLEDDEVHALSGFALRVESLFRVRDLSGWMENDEDGKQSSVLAHYGRLGITYDQCMKVVIELLREEGMYKSRGFVVADVVKDAVKESFLLYLEGRAPDDEHTLSLVKAMSAALVIRGAQLSIVQRLDGENVVTVHQELIAWIAKKIAQYEKSGNKKLRNSAIEFFHSLTQLLISADSGDAAQIQEHLKETMSSLGLEPSQTARFWEPLRSYEKRLTTIATKDREKGPGKGRRKSKKQSAKSGDEATTDEEMVLDDVQDDEPPLSPPPRPSPQRKTRSRKSLGKETATEAPERPKARPRPRTRNRGQHEPDVDADEEDQADEPSHEANGNLNSPQASPEPVHSMPNGNSRSPERGAGKRKRELEDFEDAHLMEDDGEEDEPTSPPARKHHSRPSSQISQISQMDVDFFKTRKRFRR
ncbi:hypothetical protein FRB90_011132 [Tulasnella sp. 427]|nr:hypothetical protein FRB90_011132 [Tulasnella sp. 427]